MKNLPLIIIQYVFFTICVPVFSNAQYTDSVGLQKINKVNFRSHIPTTIHPHITYRSFVIPAFMIGYGFTSLRSDGLADINEDIREEIWSENPHKLVHIDNYLQFVPAVAVYGLNLAGIKGKHNLKDRSIIYLMSNVITNATVFSLKSLTKKERPDGSSNSSFPSGHTAEAFASAEFLRQEYKDISPWYGFAGYAIATATGALRIYNNKHWLSDVVAGAGIGIASSKLSYWIYAAMKKKFSPNKEINAMVIPYYNNKTAGLSCVYTFAKPR